MKSAVMIAYAFPPEGSAGAHRPLRFVRHLPPLGWRATVISLATNAYERYDPGLLDLVPSDTEVIRVRNPDPWIAFQQWRGKRIQRKLSGSPPEKVRQTLAAHQAPFRPSLRETARIMEAWCYHPDVAMGWIRPAVRATLKICAHKQPDVIWATAGPVSSFVVAQRAAHYAGVPYVLDFRDAWTITYNEFEARRPAWATRVDRDKMFGLLKGAQAVIFRYGTEAECFWRAYPGSLDASRIHIIPNGYEGTIEEFSVSKGGKCEILYTGTLSDYRYDTLLQALCSLKLSSPDLVKRLHFHFVGEGTEALGRESAALGLAGVVTTSGPISQGDATRLSRQAHALLVLGRPPRMKGYELFAAAKLFGYLKAGRPIVGVLPSDETSKILRRVGISTVADADSPSDIATVLQHLLSAWWTGSLHLLVPDPAACEAYSAPRQTTALVRALEGIPAAAPFVPGTVQIPPSLRKDIGADGWICNQGFAWRM